MKILESIEKEVDELSEQACRKWLKRYKQAMYLIHGKLCPKNYGIVGYFDGGVKNIEKTNLLNTRAEARAELSVEIASIIDEYKVNYAKDILGTCNDESENLKQWKEYFEDRNNLIC